MGLLKSSRQKITSFPKALVFTTKYDFEDSFFSRTAGVKYNNGEATVTYFSMILFGGQPEAIGAQKITVLEQENQCIFSK
jgi:hypothetical protein